MGNLTNERRRALYDFMIARAKCDEYYVLQRGAVKEAAAHFKVSTKTVSRIWRRARGNLLAGKGVDVESRIKGNSGRKSKQLSPEVIQSVPVSKRTTLRQLSIAISVPLSTLHGHLKSGILRSHTNNLKPHLTPVNKQERLRFCFERIIKMEHADLKK